MKEVIERCNWLVNKCEDKAITPDVKDDVRYLLEEIERLNKMLEEKFMKEYPFLVENGIICKKNKEIERLNNIINEFEKWLEEKSTIDYSCSAIIVHEQMALWWALRHLQELKGGDKE